MITSKYILYTIDKNPITLNDKCSRENMTGGLLLQYGKSCI